MTFLEQLESWVNGKSVHNKERDECCPDFSCCNKKMDTPISERKAFLEAYKEGDDETMNLRLASYLQKAIAGYKSKRKVYIAGFMK